MCEALKDSARNNYCAYSLRKQKFEAECSGKFGIVSEASAPAVELPTTLPPKTSKPSAYEETEAEAKAAGIVITMKAKLGSPSTPVATTSLTSLFKGDARVQSISPAYKDHEVALATAYSAKIISPDLGNCEIEIKQFEDPSDDGHGGKKVGFALLSLTPEPMTAAKPGCAAKFASMQAQGFTAEFSTVRVSGPKLSARVAKVILEVAP